MLVYTPEANRIESFSALETASLDKISLINSDETEKESRRSWSKKKQSEGSKQDKRKTLPNSSIIIPISVHYTTFTSEDLTLENIINLMRKKPTDRDAKSLNVIKNHLEGTDLAYKFKEDKLEGSTLERILYFCSMYVNYKFLEKDSVLFRIGDIGDKFYIILQGRVKILKPIKESVKMSAFDYYNHLKDLRNNGDNYLLKMTINDNNSIFPIDHHDIEELEDIAFKVRYRRTLIIKPSYKELQKIFNESQINPSVYDLDIDELSQLEQNNKESFSSQIQRQLSILSTNNDTKKLEKYRYIENELEKKMVTIYSYQNFMTLEESKYFGDYAIEGNNTRCATIAAEEDTHLGVLDSSYYREYVGFEKQRLNLKEIMFFLDNFFFNSIKKKLFEKKYFQHFIFEEHPRGTILFKEDDNLNYLYFIKDGEIELTINKNILEIHKIIKHLLDLKLIDENKFNNYQLQIEPKNFLNELMKKKINKLFLYGVKEILGLEEFFFNLNYMYQAKVTEKAKVYKLDVKNLIQILHEEKDCYAEMEKSATSKMIKFIERLINIKNISLGLLDGNISNKNKFVNKKESVTESKFANNFNFTAKINVGSLNKINNLRKLEETKRAEELIQKEKTEKIDTKILRTHVENSLNSNNNSVSDISFNPNLNPHAKISLPESKITLPIIKNDLKKEILKFEYSQIKKLKKEINNFNQSTLQSHFNGKFSMNNFNETRKESIPETKKIKKIDSAPSLLERLKLSISNKRNETIDTRENLLTDFTKSILSKTISTRHSEINNNIALVNMFNTINTSIDINNNDLVSSDNVKFFRHAKKIQMNNKQKDKISLFKEKCEKLKKTKKDEENLNELNENLKQKLTHYQNLNPGFQVKHHKIQINITKEKLNKKKIEKTLQIKKKQY